MKNLLLVICLLFTLKGDAQTVSKPKGVLYVITEVVGSEQELNTVFYLDIKEKALGYKMNALSKKDDIKVIEIKRFRKGGNEMILHYQFTIKAKDGTKSIVSIVVDRVINEVVMCVETDNNLMMMKGKLLQLD